MGREIERESIEKERNIEKEGKVIPLSSCVKNDPK